METSPTYMTITSKNSDLSVAPPKPKHRLSEDGHVSQTVKQRARKKGRSRHIPGTLLPMQVFNQKIESDDLISDLKRS